MRLLWHWKHQKRVAGLGCLLLFCVNYILAAYFFVLQHRIDDISLAIHRRLELVVDDDGLFAGMSLQHAAFEAPEIEK